MALTFRPRRGKKATMASGEKADIILASGEIFVEYPNTGVGTGFVQFKIGDGTTKYSDLPYATPFIFGIMKNGTTVDPDSDGKIDITIGIGDITGLESALEGKLDSDANAASASKWNIARNINGMSIDGSENRVNYGICSSFGSITSKTVACPGFALVIGAEITVKFTSTNTASNPTLDVNSTGAKPIIYRGSMIDPDVLAADRVYTFRYDGTNYDLVGDIDTNTETSLADLGVTATPEELNTMDGITTTTEELNKLHGVTITNTELNYLEGLTSAIQDQLNEKAASIHTHTLSSLGGELDASKLTGTIDIARLPAAALERCVVVPTDTARFALTVEDVQLGDTVKVTETGQMYMVVDSSQLDTDDGYVVYSSGTASSVPWSGITGKPSTFTPSTHSHPISQITNLQTALDGMIKGLRLSGSTLTYTKYDDTSGTITFGDAAAKDITDSTAASAIGTGANLVTERDVYYGLPKFNNGHNYTSNTNYYAPTSGGSAGQILKANGSTSTPTWVDPEDAITTLDCGDEG